MDTHYRTIIEHSQEAVVILQQCHIKYVNHAAAVILGFPAQALIGLDFSGFLHPDNQEAVAQDICAFTGNALRESNEIHSVHSVQIVDGKGVEKLLDARLVSMTWEADPALLCFLRDVSADIRAQVEMQEREAIFNALIDRAYSGIVVIQNGRLVHFNGRMAEMLGYTAGEILNTKFTRYIHPDEISKITDRYTRRLAGEDVPARYESRLVHKNGRCLIVEFNAAVVPFRSQPADFIFVRDVTERREQQAALERTNRELSTLFNAATVISSNLSLDKVLEAVAVQMTNALGVRECAISLLRPESNLLEILVDFCFDPAQETEAPGTIYDLNEFPATLEVIKTGQPLLIRHDDPNADEAELAVMLRKKVFVLLMLPLISRDRVIGVVELMDDTAGRFFSSADIHLSASLTAQAAVAVEKASLYAQAQAEIAERQRAESRANRYLEQQLIVNQLALRLGQLTRLDDIYQAISVQVRSLLPVDSFIISFYNEETQMIRAGFVYAYGRQLDTQTLPDIPLAEEGKGMQSRVIRSGLPLYVSEHADVQKYVQTRHTIRHDGSILENKYAEEKEDLTQSQLYVPMKIGGRCIGVMQIQSKKKDVYAQVDVDLLSSLANMAAIAIQNARLLQKTREQGVQVEQIVSSVPDGVLLLDANKRLVMANPAAQSYLPLLADTQLGETLGYLGERPLSELLESPPKGLWHEVVGGGRYFDVVARAIKAGPAPGGWVMVIHDVTREKETQTRLQQQNRLAAVGQLAAGIAHDFNNIMTVISLYTDLIERSEEQLSATGQKRLQIIAQQSNRAADLIEQILDFSRRSVLERRPMDFLPFLKEVIKLLDRTLIENVHIKLNHDSGDYVVNADPTRMQQMLMNLAVNARDAMPNGGELRFELSTLRVDDPARDKVDDFGNDLQPGHWLQLQVSDNGSGIEPDILPHIFDPFYTTKAPGSGSGLGLAQVWGIMQQHEGHISVTTVADRGTTFTLHLPLFGQEAPVLPVAVSSDAAGGSRETILLVEDNVMAREVLVESLRTLNYEVITAVNGLDALEIMKNQGEDITLIISDVVMPEMGGISLLKTLRDGGWETAVLLLTGHPLNKELDEALTYPDVEWLSKPVTLEQLADAVNSHLDKEVFTPL